MKRAIGYLRWLTSENHPLNGETEMITSVLDMFEDSENDAFTLYNAVMDEDGIAGTEMCNDLDEIGKTYFQAVFSVICCMLRMKYEYEGQKYIPEDIESIQAEKLDNYFCYLSEKNPDAKECYAYFCSKVCL